METLRQILVSSLASSPEAGKAEMIEGEVMVVEKDEVVMVEMKNDVVEVGGGEKEGVVVEVGVADVEVAEMGVEEGVEMVGRRDVRTVVQENG
jgi:hypothetical protein